MNQTETEKEDCWGICIPLPVEAHQQARRTFCQLNYTCSLSGSDWKENHLEVRAKGQR